MAKIRTYLDELRACMTPSGLFARIDVERCLALVDSIEECLPETVRQAEQIIASKQNILARANEQATLRVRTAEQTAARMTSDSVILARADEEAARLTGQAQARGQSMLEENKMLACELMESLVRHLSSLKDRASDYLSELRPSARKRL